MKIKSLFFGLLAAAALSAQARINVVTLPERDSVQLTIYNSVDLTLVRETRKLTFKKGINRLEFSWANTLIDPTSLELRPLTHADQIEVVDVSFPPRVSNLLEWRINSEFSGEAAVEIRYFTSGISWAADYLMETTTDESKMDMAGFVKITNNSGEDYENAQARLVVGVIRLVEEIAALAQAPKPSGKAGEMLTKAKEPEVRYKRELNRAMTISLDAAEQMDIRIGKEGLSEYFVYTIGTRTDLPNGWSKRLQSLTAKSVPVTAFYKYEREVFGERVQRYLKIKNDKPSNLGGEPLPDGKILVVRKQGDDNRVSFLGRTETKYIPVGETVELALQDDQQIMVQPRLMNWQKINLRFDNNGNVSGWTTIEDWEIELQNSRDIPVTVDVRRHFQGDWNFGNASSHEKVDSTKVKFLNILPPRQQLMIRYQVTVNHGVNRSK